MVERAVIPEALLRAANKDRGTRGRVRAVDAGRRVAIVCDGRVVGFYTPHEAANGDKRIGPVYVLPEYRGRGLVSAIYRSISGSMMACIEAWNVDSERLHERAGFRPWKRYAHGQYWRRA